MVLERFLVFNREQHDRRRGGTRNDHDEMKGGTRLKTEERASFLEWGEANMVSHRPRKRTWTNQKKGPKEGTVQEKRTNVNAVQHSPCAKSAARGGAQRSLRHHRRLQRSMDLRALLRDKFTILLPTSPLEKHQHSPCQPNSFWHTAS